MKDIWSYILKNLDVYIPIVISLITAFFGFVVGTFTSVKDKNNQFIIQRYEELFKPFFLIVDKYNRVDGKLKWDKYSNEDVNIIFELLLTQWIYEDTLMRAIINKMCIVENKIVKNDYENIDDKNKDSLEQNESFELLCKIFRDEWNNLQLRVMWTRSQRIKNWFIRKYRIIKYKIKIETNNKENM